jgi:hypothetical protein
MMNTKQFLSAVLATCLVAMPVQKASADSGDFVVGAIIGGILGANAKQTRRSRLPSTSEGREIQTSLNYFGFPAGSVDGQLGARSRQAISMYQAYLGFPTTGQLTPLEQSVLVTSYNRAQLGGYATTQQISTHPDGVRGLLKLQLAELTGVNPNSPVVVTEGDAGDTGSDVKEAASQPALPNFLGGGQKGQSLALHCNTVNLVTNSNGGFVTLANMSDPTLALNEQFCLARSYAMSISETEISKVQGFTPDQITAQCQGLGPTMQPYVSALSLQDRSNVLASVGSFVLSSGIQPQQLSGMARICLGVGYRLDDMNVAIGSALLLSALGEGAFGELMGHHLSQGIGATKRQDLAQVWYQEAVTAIQSGQKAEFAPGAPERNDLILQAAFAMDTAAVPGTAAQPSLPVFGTGSN